MSIMDSAVSGMLANSNWLATISQNVSNANTTGYKNVGTEFSALVDQTTGSVSQVAGVASSMRSMNALQGQVESTSTTTDLAVQGAGFFVVSNSAGDLLLTRNGSFIPDSAGNLVNSAGYYLMGAATNGATNVTLNASSGLSKVNVDGSADAASPSTTATIIANLPATASAVAPGNLPSVNSASSTYSEETSLVAFDDLGGPQTINLYFSKTGPNTWEVDAYPNSAASSGGGFPYSSGPLVTQKLTFSPTTGALASGSPLSIPVPGGQTVAVDLSNATQLATSFGVTSATVDGNAPGNLTGVTIAQSGILSYIYGNGSSYSAYMIPLGNVESPDNLTSIAGDAYQVNYSSGAMKVGNAGTSGFGTVNSSSIEESTVDLATELTNMIQAQSAYEANSKVFQTGAKLLDVLNGLQA